MIIPEELFDLFREHIEIEDTVSESIQEVRIMRDDDDRLIILCEELCEIPDAFWIEIIRRLVEEEDIRLLDQC